MKKKYIEIYHTLVEDIQKGEYLSGETLPSEHELSSRFHTSRETIRKALNLLSHNGYIQKVRGKGSVVLDRDKFEFPVSGLTSFKELSERLGQSFRTHVHELTLVKEAKICRQLNCPAGASLWRVIRAREIGGERIILDKDYIRQDLVPELTKEIVQHSLYNYIENELELDISFAKKEIVVEPVTEEDEVFLDLKGHHQVVVIRSYVYLADTTAFQFTESRHRPDKFQFVDFARRTKG
ncbi:transcriptional regulator, GntR family [Halobacillus karajensis]|uniref:Trehalose operon repressor n=1 Tax=Halobacillus karajensis TaxID=195088 RepID=A0A024P3N4_9BACI|nr:trehalose operon repressor [Halobacillus karajensis]CDQ18674.1 Trehalose operon transcriptional repressor [Halobacillus karajensis]CDQ23254.1 Trehalose operon transcriptional repressor [Halobacillus karajensis]CDQ26736.1 Trehalose operon transcriptional repressor [Halobacillus karajensis]SEH48306.1 transcriptional regulator, GntR family [Halobacillus karajensis]